jgi:ABC-type antimicrobial peptide transport system permease subunit
MSSLNGVRGALAAVTQSASGRAGLVITLAFVAVAAFGPYFVPFPPYAIVGKSFLPPSWRHLMASEASSDWSRAITVGGWTNS